MAKRTFTPDFSTDKPFRIAFTRGIGYAVIATATGATVVNGEFGADREDYLAAYELALTLITDAALAGARVAPGAAEYYQCDDGKMLVAYNPPAEEDSAPSYQSDEGEAIPQTAYLAGLVPDPETWVAVSEAPCEADDTAGLDAREAELAARCDCFALGIEQPECLARGATCDRRTEPTSPAGAVSAIARADLFDALCQAADELRDYWRDVPKRLKAINEAWEQVILAELFWFDARGNLLVESESSPGTWYAVGHTCPCTAGRWGGHCRHSVIADILGRARHIARLSKVAA